MQKFFALIYVIAQILITKHDRKSAWSRLVWHNTSKISFYLLTHCDSEIAKCVEIL
jgi:hypothetical protein